MYSTFSRTCTQSQAFAAPADQTGKHSLSKRARRPHPPKARAIIKEYASVAHLCIVASRHHQQAAGQYALGKQRERLDGQTNVFFPLVSTRRQKRVTWEQQENAAVKHNRPQPMVTVPNMAAYAPINGQKHGAPPQLRQHLASRLGGRGQGDARVQNAGLSLCRGKRAHENSLGEVGVHDYGVGG